MFLDRNLMHKQNLNENAADEVMVHMELIYKLYQLLMYHDYLDQMQLNDEQNDEYQAKNVKQNVV